jgi:hypothetical protein
MPGCRHLLDALSECAATTDDVRDLGLVTIDFHRTWPKKIGGRVQVDELCFHVLFFSWRNLNLVFSNAVIANKKPSS